MFESDRSALTMDLTLAEESQRLCTEAQRLRSEFPQTREHIRWVIETIHRQWRPDFYRPLQNAIRVMHGCGSKHLASFALRKVAKGETVWEGTVEEFCLVGHPAAARCYAWTYEEEGKVRSFSILKLPPVDTPHQAVQLALAARELGKKMAGAVGA